MNLKLFNPSLIAVVLTFSIGAFAQEKTETKADAKVEAKTEKTEKSDSKPSKEKAAVEKKAKEIIAVIHTTEGDITIKLFDDKAPETVKNFVGLATGKKEWTDAKTGKIVKGKSLYKGTIFHRIIPDFMIQGGDPEGQGTGGPGYTFKDEFSPFLTFDKPYLLAMANRGPETNGSQFFITVKETPWLNNKHTIFGEVTKGQKVVDKIVMAPQGAQNRPIKPVTIKSIDIK